MVIRDQDIKTLKWLGLTERQAKVYLALLQIGSSGAEAVSKLSSVHRQEVYRVATYLQHMGLVETNLTKPRTYRAVPVKRAIEIMLNQKNTEYDEVLIHAKHLIDKYNRVDIPAISHSGKPCFAIVSGNECIRKMKNAVECTRKSIKMVSTFKIFCQLFSIHEELLKDALANNVCIQVITDGPSAESIPNWVLQKLFENEGLFELKIVPTQLQTAVVLYDNAQFCLSINVTSDITRGSQLWSNSESLIALSREYFDFKWLRSDLYLPKKIK